MHCSFLILLGINCIPFEYERKGVVVLQRKKLQRIITWTTYQIPLLLVNLEFEIKLIRIHPKIWENITN